MLTIPGNIISSNHAMINGIEPPCMFLERCTYPYRYLAMVSKFARPILYICKEINNLMNHNYKNFAHLLKDFNQPWLAPLAPSLKQLP